MILLLNNSYEPLSIVSDKDAVCYLVTNKAAGASQKIGARLHTPNDVFEVPSIIRLKHYANVPSIGINYNRRNVFIRDQYTCIYCGRQLPHKDAELEHILPRSRGGATNWVNTACSCHECNQRKGDRMPHEAGMKLLWEPKRPRTNLLVVGGNIPQEWKIYLKS